MIIVVIFQMEKQRLRETHLGHTARPSIPNLPVPTPNELAESTRDTPEPRCQHSHYPTSGTWGVVPSPLWLSPAVGPGEEPHLIPPQYTSLLPWPRRLYRPCNPLSPRPSLASLPLAAACISHLPFPSASLTLCGCPAIIAPVSSQPQPVSGWGEHSSYLHK